MRELRKINIKMLLLMEKDAVRYDKRILLMRKNAYYIICYILH